MKNLNLIFCAVMFALSSSCQIENLNSEEVGNRKPQPTEDTEIIPDLENLNDACVSVQLIAGQHNVAGDVSVYNDGENLIVIYTSIDDWTLGTTHLSLGNCDEDWVPLSKSGNPKIGQFKYTEPFSVAHNEVVYVISLADLNDNYCFAAHAEVQGTTGGETAWAQGAEFSGNSWAMFVDSFLSDCPSENPLPV